MLWPLCSAPHGPDGRVLYDPYERTKEEALVIGLVSVAILAVQVGLAYKLHRQWVYPGIGAMLLALHPGWTLRFATDMRSGDCGFLQLAGSFGFLVLHGLLVGVQLVHGAWRRSRGDPERADYGERPG